MSRRSSVPNWRGRAWRYRDPVGRLRHCEYFHTHARAEEILFDGVLRPAGDGCLHPDPGRPGLGIELRRAQIEEYAL